MIACEKNNEVTPNNHDIDHHDNNDSNDDHDSNTDTVVCIYDTIKPLEYFPAFPGSYWVYNDHDTLKVADQYEMYIFNSASYALEADYDTLILPKLLSNNIFNSADSFTYVNEYKITKSHNSNYKDPIFKGLLSLTEGAEFTIGAAVFNHQIIGKTIKVDTAINIGTTRYENVIVTIQFDKAALLGGTPEHCASVREYYAKGIGLIKREKRNYPIETEFVKSVELVEYKINH